MKTALLVVFFILGSPGSINQREDGALEEWIYDLDSGRTQVYIRDGMVEDSQSVTN